MPLPFQLNHINLWLLEDGPGWTIIDTGVGLDDTRALWERIFATHLDGRPVRRVLVTHFHPDHMGNAGWLTARWRTELWCTQAEWLYAQYSWRSGSAADFEPRLAHFRRHGCGPDALAQLGRRGNHYPRLVPEVATEFHRIGEGDSITIGRRTFRVDLQYLNSAVRLANAYRCPSSGVQLSARKSQRFVSLQRSFSGFLVTLIHGAGLAITFSSFAKRASMLS